METAGNDPAPEGSDPAVAPGPFARFRTLATSVVRFATDRLRTRAWVFVLIAGAGPLLWSRPYGDLLFGQDSARLFQPFAFNVSPLIPYSYLYSSTFPVPDFTPYFYVDATLRLFDDLGSPAWFSERLVIGVFAGIAAAGVVVLLRAVDSARDPPVFSSGITVGLVALVYVYNPFTLSVTFWHVEGWTLFLAFLPWIAALAVRVVSDAKLPVELAVMVVLVGVYLAPGAISSFAVPISLIVLWALLAVWLTSVSRPFGWRLRLRKTALLLGVGAGVEGWSFVPFLLIPNLAYTSNNYVTPENLVATYTQASATWGPYPVLTLTAFSWLVRTPSAYPWIDLLPTIAVAAVVYPLVVLLGARRLRASPGSLLLYAAGLSALPFIVGAIAPITGLHLALLRFGGPFLVLVAGYYILGPMYLLLIVVGLHETIRPSARPREPEAGAPRARPRLARWRAWMRPVTRPSGPVTLAIVLLLLVSALPFALGNVYQTRGPNVDTLSVPPSYELLGDYFGTPSAGPDFYVLAVPMSAQNGVYLNVSGRHFYDTSNLLASFVPYPLLQTNNGATAAAVEDALASGTLQNLAAVLENLHVRYVVDNPFANRSAPEMNRAPDGNPIDYSQLRSALGNALGTPATVGEFSVYSVPGAIPLGWASSGLVGVQTPTDAATLDFVGGVTQGDPAWTGALGAALWTPDGSLPGWHVRPVPVTGTNGTLTIAPGEAATSVNSTGVWGTLPCSTGTCRSNGSTFQWTGSTVAVQGPVERSSGRAGDYLASGPPSSSGYCTTGGSGVSLTATGSVTGPAVLGTEFTLTAPGPGNWATLQLSSGNLTLQAQVYQNGTATPAILSLAGLYRGAPFVWHNVNVPVDLATGVPWTVSVDWNATDAWAAVSSAGTNTSTGLAFGSRTVDVSNPGFNAAAAPDGSIALTQANESITLTGGSFCLRSTVVGQRPDVSYLVAAGPGAPSSAPTRGGSSVTSSGDFRIDAAGARYAVLGYPVNPLWTASAPVGLSGVSGAPLANVVAVSGSPNGTTVTMHFRTWILLGLDLSFLQVAALVGLLVFLIVRPRRRARPPPEGPRTSTPDASSPAPPRSRTPSQ